MKNIHFAKKGIFEKIKNNQLIININKMGANPIVILSEKIQKMFRKSIETYIIDTYGPCHNPIITAEILLPDGRTFKATGSNQKLAKQKAAEEALKNL